MIVLRNALLLWTSLIVLGCDARIERFPSNDVYTLSVTKSRSTPAEVASDDVSVAVEELFGTPDEPAWPASDEGDPPLVDLQNLIQASGPVGSEKDGRHRGLFREHCVACHGLSGDGAGPASVVQNPYPRDFRRGVFKWNSTERASKPTREDLRRLLKQGIRGTAMPSFALLSSEDREALIDYVIYLSTRGEVERRLVAAAVDELDYAETKPQQEWRIAVSEQSEGGEVVQEVIEAVRDDWRAANDEIVVAPEIPELSGKALQESIDRGKGIFHGPIANCVGCHGPSGNGESLTLDYDDWTKEYSTRIGLTPSDREAMRPFRDVGALRPRPIEPRNLRDGVFRGGGDPQTLYRRISQGIAGTPMPSMEIVTDPGGKGLTVDQVWDLVRYVQSLSTTP